MQSHTVVVSAVASLSPWVLPWVLPWGDSAVGSSAAAVVVAGPGEVLEDSQQCYGWVYSDHRASRLKTGDHPVLSGA